MSESNVQTRFWDVLQASLSMAELAVDQENDIIESSVGDDF